MTKYFFTVCPEKDSLKSHKYTRIKYPFISKHKCNKWYDQISRIGIVNGHRFHFIQMKNLSNQVDDWK